jgi:hypothetical protein
VNDNRFDQEDEVAMESVVVPEEKVIAVDIEAVPNSLSRCNL